MYLFYSLFPLSPRLGPISPQLSYTKCTQGLAEVPEQGEGTCPLASGPAEVGPVLLSPSALKPLGIRLQKEEWPGCLGTLAVRHTAFPCISMSFPAPKGQAQHQGKGYHCHPRSCALLSSSAFPSKSFCLIFDPGGELEKRVEAMGRSK